MHKGEDTAYYLKKGFDVIAFEADPELIAHCRMKFANEIDTKRLIIIEGAIVDFQNKSPVPKTVKFFKNTDVSVWGTVMKNWATRNEILGTSNKILEVPAINFTEYLKKYGIPYYLKIDIEGMDIVCLEALLNFKEKPDYISIESEKVSFDKLRNEFRVFKKLWYVSFQAINQTCVSQQKEVKNSAEGYCTHHVFQDGSSGVFGKDLDSHQ